MNKELARGKYGGRVHVLLDFDELYDIVLRVVYEDPGRGLILASTADTPSQWQTRLAEAPKPDGDAHLISLSPRAVGLGFYLQSKVGVNLAVENFEDLTAHAWKIVRDCGVPVAFSESPSLIAWDGRVLAANLAPPGSYCAAYMISSYEHELGLDVHRILLVRNPPADTEYPSITAGSFDGRVVCEDLFYYLGNGDMFGDGDELDDATGYGDFQPLAEGAMVTVGSEDSIQAEVSIKVVSAIDGEAGWKEVTFKAPCQLVDATSGPTGPELLPPGRYLLKLDQIELIETDEEGFSVERHQFLAVKLS